MTKYVSHPRGPRRSAPVLLVEVVPQSPWSMAIEELAGLLSGLPEGLQGTGGGDDLAEVRT